MSTITRQVLILERVARIARSLGYESHATARGRYVVIDVHDPADDGYGQIAHIEMDFQDDYVHLDMCGEGGLAEYTVPADMERLYAWVQAALDFEAARAQEGDYSMVGGAT